MEEIKSEYNILEERMYKYLLNQEDVHNNLPLTSID